MTNMNRFINKKVRIVGNHYHKGCIGKVTEYKRPLINLDKGLFVQLIECNHNTLNWCYVFDRRNVCGLDTEHNNIVI